MQNKWYSSSANAEKLALTIKGILVAVIPALIFIGSIIGIGFAEADLTQIVEVLTTFLSAGMILFGLVRKVVLKYKDKV